MKLYVLHHPILGFFAGNKDHKYWTPDFQFARKWNRKCDATNCKAQTNGNVWLTDEATVVSVDCYTVLGQ